MRKLTSQKLFRSRKWRLVSVELWNKFAYCPTWTLYNVWSFHKHNSSRFMLIRAFINVSESFNFNKTADFWPTFKHILQLFIYIGQLFMHIGQPLYTLGNFLYTLGNFLYTLGNFLYTLGNFLLKPSGHLRSYYCCERCGTAAVDNTVVSNNNKHSTRYKKLSNSSKWQRQ